MNNKCNINFQSKFAYVRNKSISIEDYITKYINKNKKCKLKCNKGHELICANGKINTPHFRHKNGDDVGGFPMTEWHCEWQSNFATTEKFFPKLNDNQIKDRKADVYIKDHNIVVEFQHSKIDSDEVYNRKKDYELNNQRTIWIIDGNNTINVKNLDYCNRFFLEFVSDTWKYKSFMCYEYIFIDINELIYKVYPANVKSDMIDVELPIAKTDFIQQLNTNSVIINKIDIPLQCNLYVKQQGAGNGKTFGLIQMLESKEFEHYKYFIIVTKQHSAKYVIYKEFKDQIKEGYLKYLTIDDERDENKKYKITYTNKKVNSQCQLVVGTIDSLMYTLGNKNNTELNKFEGLVNSIIDGYIEKNNIKTINYNGININLNKEVCLICDETQDLTKDYSKAIIHIMRNKYIDAYIVGDKLQSLVNSDNAFTYLMDNNFPYINKKSCESVNICRRFNNSELIQFVNSIVPFNKYSLPCISPYRVEQDNNGVINIFVGQNIYADEKDENKINIEVEKIMNYYDKEVIDNNYKPNDFLFITPFTNKNPLVNAIEIAISMYWNKKYNNNTFERYAVFHKSEEGTSINLSESEEATRIVSIHTSKGDGRNIVFVIGLDEQSLIKFSNESNNLIYDSLIHVAFTRMKKKLYIRVVENNDDICQRIMKYTCENNLDIKIKPNLLISNKIKYQDITDYVKTNEDFETLKDNIINNCTNLQFNREDKLIIDMGHHTIRYSSMIIYLYIKILRNEDVVKDDDVKKQIKAKFIEVKDYKIYQTTSWQEYNDYLKKKDIALLKLSNNGREYNRYFNIIYNCMICIKNKIKGIFDNEINMLCPLESVILYYMIQICKNGIYSDISINELYNVVDIYYKSFNNNIKGHDNCICKEYFKLEQKESNNNVIQLTKYLLNHYERINNMGNVYEKFLNNYPKVNWLIDHYVELKGNDNDLQIKRKFQLIGYDNENVFIVYVKPQLNNLNYNQTLIDSIFDTYLLNNIKEPNEDIHESKKYNKLLKDCERFKNKDIKTIIFTLDQDNYISIEWKHDDENLINKYRNIIVEKIKNKLIKKYVIESKYIYYFYKYSRDKIIKKNLTPDKTIKNIINEFKNDKNKDKVPDFIFRFLYKIENKIEDVRNKKEKEDIINSYDDKDYFLEKINEKIVESIEDFLEIEN